MLHSFPTWDIVRRLPADNRSGLENRRLKVAFRLFCKQARWDGDGVIDRCLDRALAILEDEKPTAVRQALAALLDVAPYKRELRPVIRGRLETMDLSRYKDSMAPLIQKDMQTLLNAMQ